MTKSGFKITIRSGTQAAAEYWLSKRLTRVGGAAGCDVRLDDPQVPAHAISIERVDDQIVVHNRTQRPFLLDATELSSGASHPWPHAATLRISPQTELELDCYATPAGSTANESSVEEESAAAEESSVAMAVTAAARGMEATPGKPASSNVLPLLFIAGCIGMIGFLIYYKQSGMDRVESKSNLTWPKVWELLPAPPEGGVPPSTSPVQEALRTRLQLLYRYQGLADSAQFQRAQGEIIRAIDREIEPPPPADADEKKQALFKQLESLREFVKRQKVGA